VFETPDRMKNGTPRGGGGTVARTRGYGPWVGGWENVDEGRRMTHRCPKKRQGGGNKKDEKAKIKPGLRGGKWEMGVQRGEGR